MSVRRFHAPVGYRLDKVNNRTHRKVLVVDGKVGFTGGVGIADAWAGRAQDAGHWRDTHFRAEGPVVAQMQAVFMDNWITLVAAAHRGVHVQIITPGEHMDAETVRRASRARWGDLLQAGVEIFEYQPTMYHCKVMVVDGAWLSVGSTNFDRRSFSLNDEANLNITNRHFAARQITILEQDVAKSKAITYSEWQQRPLVEKLIEHTASLLRMQP